MRRLLRTVWIAAGLFITAWIVWGFQAAGVPPETMESNATVRVIGNSFQPTANANKTGVLFLPGGMVEPIAYAPLLKSLAAAGHPAILIPLPYRCACTDSQVASLFTQIRETIAAHPKTRWSLAGHSRGAMLATRFARESPTQIAGLILIATTHPRDFDLSASPLPITKILGSLDGVASPTAARANARLLPAATRWIEIPGANHVQFGYYRHQLGDNTAAISRAEQQSQLFTAILRSLN